MTKTRISWHPGFVQGLEAELSEFEQFLQFIEEQPLTTEPLRIDITVIKKTANVFIDVPIAHCFLGHNVFEYKSPKTTLTVQEFFRAIARVYLYISIYNVSSNDVTLSFVTAKHPVKLLTNLKERGIETKKYRDGVYYIEGFGIPIQMIVQKNLNPDDSSWLRNYRSGLTMKELDDISILVEKSTAKLKLLAYLGVLIKANEELLKGGNKMPEITKEWMYIITKYGLDKIWEKQGIEQGIEQDKLDTVFTMLSENEPIEKIARYTRLSVERINEIKESSVMNAR